MCWVPFLGQGTMCVSHDTKAADFDGDISSPFTHWMGPWDTGNTAEPTRRQAHTWRLAECGVSMVGSAGNRSCPTVDPVCQSVRFVPKTSQLPSQPALLVPDDDNARVRLLTKRPGCAQSSSAERLLCAITPVLGRRAWSDGRGTPPAFST